MSCGKRCERQERCVSQPSHHCEHSLTGRLRATLEGFYQAQPVCAASDITTESAQWKRVRHPHVSAAVSYVCFSEESGNGMLLHQQRPTS